MNRLADNPLVALSAHNFEEKGEKQNYETLLLEKILRRVSHLLQIGFGAAGADIIKRNLGEGDLNAMLPGIWPISQKEATFYPFACCLW